MTMSKVLILMDNVTIIMTYGIANIVALEVFDSRH